MRKNDDILNISRDYSLVTVLVRTWCFAAGWLEGRGRATIFRGLKCIQLLCLHKNNAGCVHRMVVRLNEKKKIQHHSLQLTGLRAWHPCGFGQILAFFCCPRPQQKRAAARTQKTSQATCWLIKQHILFVPYTKCRGIVRAPQRQNLARREII